MNVRRDRQSEGAEGRRQGRVQRCCQSRVAEPKALVPDVSSERDGADYPRTQPPGDAHLIGRGPTGERTECDADDRIHHT